MICAPIAEAHCRQFLIYEYWSELTPFTPDSYLGEHSFFGGLENPDQIQALAEMVRIVVGVPIFMPLMNPHRKKLK